MDRGLFHYAISPPHSLILTIMVNLKNSNKSMKNPTLPFNLQNSSQCVGESWDLFNLLSRAIYKGGKWVYSRERFIRYSSHLILRLKIVDLVVSHFLSYFIFLSIYFYFSIFRTLGLGLEVISHIWWCGHSSNHETWKKEVEGSGTKWHYTTWTPHVGLMLDTWSFRVEYTVPSTDHL